MKSEPADDRFAIPDYSFRSTGRNLTSQITAVSLQQAWLVFFAFVFFTCLSNF